MSLRNNDVRADSDPSAQALLSELQPSDTIGRRSVVAIVWYLVIIELCCGLMQGWMLPLLGNIGTKFDVSASGLSLVTSSYLLASALFVPVLAKLGDKVGHVKILRIAVALAALGCVMVALAPTYEILIAGRVMTGAATVFIPLEFAIVRDKEKGSNARSIGLLIGGLTVGGALGGVFAGLMLRWTESLTLTLWVPAIAMILCMIIPFFLIPETTTRDTGRIDWLGAIVLGAGLGTLLLGISKVSVWGWNSSSLGLIGAGIAMLGAWVLHELRTTEPLVGLRKLRSSGTGPLFAITVLVGDLLFALSTIFAIYVALPKDSLGYGLGLDALTIGILLALVSLAMLVGASSSSRLCSRFGGRDTLAIGMGISLIGYVAQCMAHHSLLSFTASSIVVLIGVGIVSATVPSMILDRTDPEASGITSGMYNMVRSASGSIGTALFGVALGQMVISGTRIPQESAFMVIWIACALLCVIGLATTRLIRPVPSTVN